MAVKIKLKRMGKIRSPHYRIIVADSRTKRDGRAIEEIGLYNPKLEPSLIKVDSERVQYWLGVGAQPTDPVLSILKVTGDWQKHKGLPGAEGTLKVAEPRPEKRAVFDAALAEVHGEPKSDATTARKKPAKKSTPKTEDKKADDKKADKKADDKKPKADTKAKDDKPEDDKAKDAKAEDAKAEGAKAEGAKAEAKKAADKKPDAKAEEKAEEPAKAEKTDDEKAEKAEKTDGAPAAEASTDES